MVGSCECGNEPPGSMKNVGNFVNSWGPVTFSIRNFPRGVS